MVTVADYSKFSELVTTKNNNNNSQSLRASTPSHRGKAYEAAKKKLQERMLAVLFEQFPQLTDKVRYVDTGTPVTNNYYLGTNFGEVSE